jgi:hypothetical protein
MKPRVARYRAGSSGTGRTPKAILRYVAWSAIRSLGTLWGTTEDGQRILLSNARAETGVLEGLSMTTNAWVPLVSIDIPIGDGKHATYRRTDR